MHCRAAQSEICIRTIAVVQYGLSWKSTRILYSLFKALMLIFGVHW